MSEEIDVIAETMPRVGRDSVKFRSNEKVEKEDSREQTSSTINQVPRMNLATIGQDGKVIIEAAKGSKPQMI